MLTLAEAGIDKKLSSGAQKLAAVPKEQFEGMIGEWRERVGKENERVTTDLLKASTLALTSAGVRQSPGSIAVASSLSPRRQSQGGTKAPRHMPAFATRARPSCGTYAVEYRR